MQLSGKALRVIIYIGESDHHDGKVLYMALLEMLKQDGASGATVTRGLAGFGARSRIQTARLVDLSSDLPIRFEWVDAAETVERLLPRVRQMVDDGLITIEEVDVIQYTAGRQPDPLAQLVKDVMRADVVTVRPQTPVADIVTLLLRRGYRSLPVVDGNNHLLGIITDGDLLRQAILYARLDLQEELSAAQLQQQVAGLRQRDEKAADLMTRAVISARETDSLRQAAGLMVQHGLKRLPVVDHQQKLTGWISRVDILRTLEYHQAVEEPSAESPREGTNVTDLMARDVPTVSPEAQLEEIVQQLEASRGRRVIVVDGERHVLGIITDGDLMRRSRHGTHQGLMVRLRNLVTGREEIPQVAFPDATETAADLMTAPAVSITAQTPLTDALRLMIRHQIKRLPVVDDEGRLLGLLGRSSLLRGLLQATD